MVHYEVIDFWTNRVLSTWNTEREAWNAARFLENLYPERMIHVRCVRY